MIKPFEGDKAEMNAVMAILAIPFKESEAVLINPGRAEHYRVAYGVKLWQEGYGNYLLVSGINPEEIVEFSAYDSFTAYDKEYLYKNFAIGFSDTTVFVQETATNTPAQTDWEVSTMKDLSIESAIITASYYHLPRVFMTMLKSMSKAYEKSNMPIIYPAPTQPVRIFQNDYINPGELERIIQYQGNNTVASFDELAEYLEYVQQKEKDF